MSMITLQQLYDQWKRVSDWVSGSGTDKPKVQPVNSSGTEIFTTATPGTVKLSDGADLLAINADGSLNVQLSGSLPSGSNTIGGVTIAGRTVTITTVINAASIAAAGFSEYTYTPIGESEAWFLVNTDAQPWALNAEAIYGVGSFIPDPFFPKRQGVVTTAPTIPVASILMPVHGAIGITAPTTLLEAKASSAPYACKIRLYNQSAGVMTGTVKIVRIWR